MTDDWLWTGVIAGAAGGFTLLFILIQTWRQSRKDSRWIDIERKDAERVVHYGDQWPRIDR